MSPRRSLRFALLIAAVTALILALTGTTPASAAPADGRPGSPVGTGRAVAFVAPLRALPGHAWSFR